MSFKPPKSQEIDDQLEEVTIDTLSYDTQWKECRVRIASAPDSKQRGVLLALARKSIEGFRKSA